MTEDHTQTDRTEESNTFSRRSTIRAAGAALGVTSLAGLGAAASSGDDVAFAGASMAPIEDDDGTVIGAEGYAALDNTTDQPQTVTLELIGEEAYSWDSPEKLSEQTVSLDPGEYTYVTFEGRKDSYHIGLSGASLELDGEQVYQEEF